MCTYTNTLYINTIYIYIYLQLIHQFGQFIHFMSFQFVSFYSVYSISYLQCFFRFVGTAGLSPWYLNVTQRLGSYPPVDQHRAMGIDGSHSEILMW